MAEFNVLKNDEGTVPFERFTAKGKDWPPYDNFHHHFIDMSEYPEQDHRRSREYFHRFKNRHPELEAKLTKHISDKHSSGQFPRQYLEPIERDLYDAYVAMREEGAENEELI